VKDKVKYGNASNKSPKTRAEKCFLKAIGKGIKSLDRLKGVKGFLRRHVPPLLHEPKKAFSGADVLEFHHSFITLCCRSLQIVGGQRSSKGATHKPDVVHKANPKGSLFSQVLQCQVGDGGKEKPMPSPSIVKSHAAVQEGV